MTNGDPPGPYTPTPGALSLIETVVVDLVAGALAVCGMPVDDSIRYHCTPPADCCSDAGVLAVSWSKIYAAGARPSPEFQWDCNSRPAADLAVRLFRCWPETDEGTWDPEADYDTAAAGLADAAWAVHLAFSAAICDGTLERFGVAYRETVAICPQGGCAGVEWRLTVRLRPTTACG